MEKKSNNGNLNESDILGADTLNVFSNSEIKRNSNLLERRVKLNTDYKADSKKISEALMGKSVVKDDENNRTLAITDYAIIEIDDKIKKGITLATESILKKFKEKVENGTVFYPNVTETLTYIEFTNAGFIDTPGFKQVKKELNKILADMMKSDNPRIAEIAKEGILDFFNASRCNIVKGRRKFKQVPYSLNNSKEKEFLRALFISEMLEDKVFDFDFLEKAGEISQLDLETIEEIYRKINLLTPEEVERAFYLSNSFKSRDEILEYYLKNDKKYFIIFATNEELVKFIVNGKIAPKDAMKKIKLDNINSLEPELLEEFLCVKNFPKGTDFIEHIQTNGKTERLLSKKMLKKLGRESFLKVVFSDKIIYKNPYKSVDYINEYGKLKFEDMMLLHNKGFINEEDLIKLTTFKSMQVQETEEYASMTENLLEFYDVERLESILKTNKLNKKFVELYNNLLVNIVSKEQRNVYFQKMNEKLKSKENSDEIITSLVTRGLEIGKEISYKISEDYISDCYIEEKISEKDIVKLYEEGLIPLDIIRELYSDDDLIEEYRAGKLDYKVLNLLKNKAEIINLELKNGRITTQQLMELYSNPKGLSIEEFDKIADGHDFGEEKLVEYLSDEIVPEKVEGLFNNYYISQDDLSELVGRGIITKEQAEEYATKIATHEQYESIFSLDNKFIILTKDTEGDSKNAGSRFGHGGTRRASRIKNDPELQELLLSQIGFDERTLTLAGTNNSLDGYRVYPSEEYGIMVFLKNDRPGNATYIMTVQQGMYFLNKMIREKKNQTGQIELGVEIQSEATKKELRETEHVKVRNASAGWGANIVSVMKKLSPSFKQKMQKTSKYRNAVNEVVEEIKEDYISRKSRDE